MTPFDLDGRTALVTGSTRGLGLELARALAGAGARVAINGRDAAATELVAASIDGAVAASFDVADEQAVTAGIERLGRVDVLVNNAGITIRGPLDAMALVDWQRVLDVNLTSAFLVARAVVPGMLAREQGKIVNVGSIMSELARPGVAAYAAAKGGIKMLTRSMCAEWGARGIQANGIAPGYFRTDLTMPLQQDAQFDGWVRARVPAGRWGEAGDLGGAVVFLASAASDYVNGQMLIVDGGLSATV
ncbi:MAG: SDR family oxidoreductase [Actinobacteria bacterium]|nr:SDR family oxidoreductase [Actinomycetota bacterium]